MYQRNWGLLFLLLASNAGTRTYAQEITFGSPALQTSPVVPLAISGEPFGVLTAEVPLPPNFSDRVPRILVTDVDGRVYYPVTTIRTVEVAGEPPQRRIGRPGGLLDRVRNAIRGDAEPERVPVAISVAALFRGTEPIELRLSGDIDQRIHIVPVSASGNEQRELLSRWWTQYTDSASQEIAAEDCPKLVHKYLTAMLATRLGLPRVDLDPPDPEKNESSQTLETVALLAAIEPLRDEILEDVLNIAGDSSRADLPVPREPLWDQAILPLADERVEIESLATRVPPECFYLRFGSFANNVWFQDISERYGGDMAQAVLLRGFNYDASARMERMLASKMTAIAKMFGDKLIGDMAVIGSDLYMKEGASLGVVFYATNPGLLSAAITTDRRAVAARTEGATIQELTISGTKVSLLSTPDNTVRSFYLSDGPFIFITTSRTLVERFVAVGAGGTSLADTPSFRWARTWMPEANDYSVFGYFSPDFFHRLVSPQYQIELRRRLEAIAHLEIAELASQAAVSEQIVSNDIRQLQSAGLLPTWFDGRPDGARTLRIEDRWVDSLRGARGSFLPIADVALSGVTQHEAERYAQTADYYQNEWRHMDPLLVGLRRFRAEGSRVEKVAIEGYIAPFEAEKYGWITGQLGAPTPLEISLPVDDVVQLQLHMRGGSRLGQTNDDYQLFSGVKDMTPPMGGDKLGFLKTLQLLRSAPAYVGAWPKPDLIELLPLGLGRALAAPDYAGYSRMLGGLWRWQDATFSLLSFDRSILDNTIRQLAVVETTDAAQARLRVADLSGSQLAGWINQTWYERGWQSSQGNARLLDTIHQQLKVPGDECLAVTQRLLDVRLQCPLGGQYQFRPLPVGQGGWWESTSWEASTVGENGKRTHPIDYKAPWIEWFRGGKVHLTQQPESLAIVGEVELEMQPLSVDLSPSAQVKLPTMSFDLFSLPMKLFGGKKSEPAAKRKSF